MDKYLWQYVMSVNPYTKPEDVLELKELNEWDLLITYANGKRILYDRCTGYFNTVFYDNVNEITEEQEKREFAYRLRSIMRHRGIIQEDLADMTGTSQVMISRYVSGESIPSAIKLNKIAKALRCSMDDFFYKDY